MGEFMNDGVINVNKAHQSIANKLERIIYINQFTEDDKQLQKSNQEEIETCKISIEMNIRIIYDSFVGFRYSKHRKTHVFTFSDIDEAFVFGQNVIKASELINRYKVISVTPAVIYVVFTYEPSSTFLS